MHRILSIVDWYLPGFKAGGPIRSVANTIDLLENKFEFFVLTRDRDLGDRHSYAGVELNAWTRTGATRIYYASRISFRVLNKRIRDVKPNVIHLNSVFSRLTLRVLLLRRFGLIKHDGIVIAPRGEFSEGAMGLKRLSKRAYLSLAIPLLFRGVTWQASTADESVNIEQVLRTYRCKKPLKIALARDPVVHPEAYLGDRAKQPGKLRLIFLSRISRMKNLVLAIKACGALEGDVIFDIYGPEEDRPYMVDCLREMQGISSNVKITLKGPVSPEGVQGVIAGYHFMILPTLGENFGHVIMESLAAGTPVIISDKTPWADIGRRNAGWVLSLDRIELWRETLQRCVEMTNQQYLGMSKNAHHFAIDIAESPAIHEEHARLFEHAISAAPKHRPTQQVTAVQQREYSLRGEMKDE